ncbi:MAG TPA: AMP-binding protein, partial [Azospirillaceae bacterium]|nr:AMP-binding protein [Azospirillaceae bacterium]
SPAGTSQPLFGERRKGSCGLPLPGVMIEIVDVDEPTKLLGVGETGEICISGPNVMKGYWKNPKTTEEAFAGGRFHTGDVGKLDQDGFVFITDRKKDMILSGGFNVYPRVIEEAMYEHPSVEEVIVVGVPDAYRGEAAKAFVKLRAGAAPFTLEELRAFLADRLGRHELPAQLEFRDALPKTAVGKLWKKPLADEERARAGGG